MLASSLVDTQRFAHLKLFAKQHLLPPLPVPDLAQTLHKYLKSLEPICTAEELVAPRPARSSAPLRDLILSQAQSRQLCAEFLASDQVSARGRALCAVRCGA